MKLYGIFDENNNYKLLRYSHAEQNSSEYKNFDYATKTFYQVKEVCLPDIEYSEDYIGKNYNPNTKTFSN